MFHHIRLICLLLCSSPGQMTCMSYLPVIIIMGHLSEIAYEIFFMSIVAQFMDLTQPFSFVGFIMQMSIDYSLAPVDSSQTLY